MKKFGCGRKDGLEIASAGSEKEAWRAAYVVVRTPPDEAHP